MNFLACPHLDEGSYQVPFMACLALQGVHNGSPDPCSRPFPRNVGIPCTNTYIYIYIYAYDIYIYTNMYIYTDIWWSLLGKFIPRIPSKAGWQTRIASTPPWAARPGQWPCGSLGRCRRCGSPPMPRAPRLCRAPRAGAAEDAKRSRLVAHVPRIRSSTRSLTQFGPFSKCLNWFLFRFNLRKVCRRCFPCPINVWCTVLGLVSSLWLQAEGFEFELRV